MGPTTWNASAAGRRWSGRLAALFFVTSGALSLLTIGVEIPDADRPVLAAVSLAAIAIGAVCWVVPWDRIDARWSLLLPPAGLLMIAIGNIAGGTLYFTYGVFFLVTFAWIGLTQPPRTSLLMAPLAVVAYVAPLFTVPLSDRAEGFASAAVVLPLCVLLGEALARGVDRLSSTEASLTRERERAEELRHLDELKSRFVRLASHELRTPITICRGHLETLPPNAAGSDVARTLELVIDELERMGRIVADMTTLTRLEDPDALTTERVPVAALLTEVAAKAEPLLGGRVAVDAPPTGTVFADRQRINQALLGLVDNVRAHAGNGADVSLCARRHPSGWRFEVRDDGVGFDGVDPASLFDPFLHRPGSAGSGLGLAMVRSVARAHGGQAGAEPADGGGSVFWITVPA
jgi:signal transduction histidine kinase